MANSKFVLACTVQESAQAVKDILNTSRGSPVVLLNSIASYFQKMSSGGSACSIIVQQTAVAAAGTVTFSSFTTGDTVTIGATTLTGSAGAPANENEFNVSGTDAQDAAALATCVNAHSVLSKYVSAAVTSTATVTITAKVPGVAGNGYALAISAHGSVVAFASGANDTNVTISHGI